MARLFKSVIYLASVPTVGYVLMKLTEPSEAKIKEIRASRYQDPQSDENRRKTELIIKKLKEAAYTSDPVSQQAKNKQIDPSQQPSKREIN